MLSRRGGPDDGAPAASSSGASTALASRAASPAASASTPSAAPRAPTARPTPTPTRPAATPRAAPAHRLVLTARGTSWFQVKRGTEVLGLGTLKKGASRTFTGAGSYDVVLGNAGNVLVDTGSGPAPAGRAGVSDVFSFVVR
ncbi:uncharacterized protein DUF4115 [Motilibacter peucedani]|uniref:Uncharacterized protein DUF4115 n=1 Tax=Motilibacter peucedani TaxID=598650 RepID=A0A420XPB2_9ACTN|nr:DUF4115 domain-containing protein [Motilibacter peucedani]RKS74033.1 uncharacterized protein DUF4115 [Motilibacter peucedani]